MNFRAKSLGYYFAALATIALANAATFAQTRIYFAPGATRAIARGYLRGVNDQADFVLRLKAGQNVRVEINGRGATRGVLIFPSGKQDGGPGGVIFDDKIDESGDYRVRVTESSMANSWRGSFTLTIDALSRRSDGMATDSGYRDLSRYAGKYPSDLFRAEPNLKTRLRALLGANYKTFFDRLQTEMPIANDAGALVVRGCMAHQCTIEEAILVITLNDGKLYVALKSTRYGGGFKTFSEDAARTPEALRRAMRDQ